MKSYSILAVVLLALAVRLGIGVFLGFNSGPDQAACGADTVEFEHMAWSAAQGGGFAIHDGGLPSAFRAPGYPMLLAAVYRIFGRTYWMNRVVLSLLGATTCWFVYLLALRLRLERPTALLAAFLTAVLPLQFYWCGHFMSEPLAAFLNVATCLLLAMAGTEGMPRRLPLFLAAGLVCGLSALTRAASLLVAPVLGGLWVLSRRVSIRSAVPWIGLFALGVAIVIAPWAIRNRVVLDRFALISTNGGSTFWGANNSIVAEPAEHWGSWISTTHIDRERKEKEVWPLANEVDRDRAEWKIGRQWVMQNARQVPLLLAGKFYRLLKPFPDSANRVYATVVGFGWLLLLPLSILGIVLILRDSEARRRFIPLNAQLLTLAATTAIFYGSERFRAPYEPFLAIYAAAVVQRGVSIAAKRRKSHKKGTQDC